MDKRLTKEMRSRRKHTGQSSTSSNQWYHMPAFKSTTACLTSPALYSCTHRAKNKPACCDHPAFQTLPWMVAAITTGRVQLGGSSSVAPQQPAQPAHLPGSIRRFSPFHFEESSRIVVAVVGQQQSVVLQLVFPCGCEVVASRACGGAACGVPSQWPAARLRRLPSTMLWRHIFGARWCRRHSLLCGRLVLLCAGRTCCAQLLWQQTAMWGHDVAQLRLGYSLGGSQSARSAVLELSAI